MDLTYKEERGDLFDGEIMARYALCHCISSNFALGAGIARRFAAMGVKDELRENFPMAWDGKGYCLFVEANGVTVANLVTKRMHYQKPTLETLRQSLEDLREQAMGRNLKKLAMPKIGCGLDRLDWKDVSAIVKDVFDGTDIEILVRFI